MDNVIKRQIELKATVSRVWRALTDYREFGEWFLVRMEGPFVAGQGVRGQITLKGYEHIPMEVMVEALVPERLFSFRWHPYAVDPAVDYSLEALTLVEFTLEAVAGGTLLTVTESGFENLSEERRLSVIPLNDRGWAQQMKNIEAHIARSA